MTELSELFEVIDVRTHKRVGKPVKNRHTAARKADRLDNEYGAYRYFYRRVKISVPSLTVRKEND